MACSEVHYVLQTIPSQGQSFIYELGSHYLGFLNSIWANGQDTVIRILAKCCSRQFNTNVVAWTYYLGKQTTKCISKHNAFSWKMNQVSIGHCKISCSIMYASKWWCHRVKVLCHNDVVIWKRFPYYWPFVRGIRWWPVDSQRGRNAQLRCFLCGKTEEADEQTVELPMT